MGPFCSIRTPLGGSFTLSKSRIEARPLTEEQRKAVVVDERRNLVVAAAGSGKTSVIVAKAGWLLRKVTDTRPNYCCWPSRGTPGTRWWNASARVSAPQRRVTSRFVPSTVCGLAIIGEAEGKRPTLARTAENDRALFDLLKDIVADLLCRRRAVGGLEGMVSGRIRAIQE